MRYSLYLVLEKLDVFVKSLRTYQTQDGLTDQDVENILQSYGEALWDTDGDILFSIESTQQARTIQKWIKLLELPNTDWDVEKPKIVFGLKKNRREFIVCSYTPNQSYIDRLDAMIEYLPDGAVLDYEYPEANDEDDSDFDSED